MVHFSLTTYTASHKNKVRKDNPQLKIIYGYGPAENTTFSTTYLIEKDFDRNIPISKPISNSIAYPIRIIKPVIILLLILASIVTFGQEPFCHKRQPVTINPNSGYVTINELHYGYGLGTTTGLYAQQYIGLTTVHGYQLNIYGLHLNRSFLAGAGSGVLFYEGRPLFPLYLDFRYILNFKKMSPFIYGRASEQ